MVTLITVVFSVVAVAVIAGALLQGNKKHKQLEQDVYAYLGELAAIKKEQEALDHRRKVAEQHLVDAVVGKETKPCAK